MASSARFQCAENEQEMKIEKRMNSTMYLGWITMMQFATDAAATATSNVSERECRPGMKEGLIVGFQLRRIDFVPAAIIILGQSSCHRRSQTPTEHGYIAGDPSKEEPKKTIVEAPCGPPTFNKNHREETRNIIATTGVFETTESARKINGEEEPLENDQHRRNCIRGINRPENRDERTRFRIGEIERESDSDVSALDVPSRSTLRNQF